MPFLSKRRLSRAGLAAVAGCAAACSLPFLLVAAGWGAAATTVASVLGGGTELVAGGLVLVGALGVMALRSRSSATRACSTSCAVDTKPANEGIPIARDPRVFSQSERAAHAERAKDLLIRRPRRRQELDDGFEFHYEGDEKLFLSLAEWATFEHRCCPWARFSVEMEPFAPGSAGTLRLRMTGGAEGKQLLLEAIKQLESDGPIVNDFLRGDEKLTPDTIAARARSCGC